MSDWRFEAALFFLFLLQHHSLRRTEETYWINVSSFLVLDMDHERLMYEHCFINHSSVNDYTSRYSDKKLTTFQLKECYLWVTLWRTWGLPSRTRSSWSDVIVSTLPASSSRLLLRSAMAALLNWRPLSCMLASKIIVSPAQSSLPPFSKIVNHFYMFPYFLCI